VTDNNDNSFPEIENSFSYYGLIADAPDFGFWQLTVKDAAALVVIDIWFAGEISVEIPEAVSYGWRDPGLRQALSKHFNDFEKRLKAAIDGGSLKTTKIRRNLNEELDTNQTLVDLDDLVCWLTERGHECGDAFEEYLDEEMHLHSSVVSEICTHRMILNNPELPPRSISKAKLDPDNAGIDELRKAVKELTNDKIELFAKKKQLEEMLRETRENHSKKTERPLSTRSRRTLLTIIAAFCNEAKIDYQDRGAAKRISEITEKLGATVTDDTIRKIISEIDDAVETRTK
jgi:hypothetical protein